MQLVRTGQTHRGEVAKELVAIVGAGRSGGRGRSEGVAKGIMDIGGDGSPAGGG